MGAYQELKQHFGTIGTLAEIDAILSWDTEAIMPHGAQHARVEHAAMLQAQLHQLTSDPRIPEWLENAQDQELLPNDRVNLQWMRRRWVRATALKTDQIKAMSKARSKCSMVWRAARKNNDFQRVVPYLEDLLSHVRNQAHILADVLERSPYDALIDRFDPDASEQQITGLFDQLAAFLPSMTEAILARQAEEPPPLALDHPIDQHQQKKIAQELMRILGFDFERGRLDESAHPFCGGIPDDVRITTNYDPDNPFFGLLGVVHETGHALYEQGLPAKWHRQPVGVARSMTIHESQSLLYEMQLAASPAFLSILAPLLQLAAGSDHDAWSAHNLERLATRVARGPIRIQADEVTYPAHIVLRFQLEKALLHQELRVKDLPEAWNEGMRRLVGITPANDTEGVLQDIHWYEGHFGYFPTYTLGALAAAQLFESANDDHDVKTGIAQGNFLPLRNWLHTHIHQHAALIDSNTLIERATGAPLGVDAFRRHLERRYL